MKTDTAQHLVPEKSADTPRDAYNDGMNQIAASNKPRRKSRKKTRHVCVESSIYRYKCEGTYHERPFINGKRTWRSLGFNFVPQRNLKAAKDEYYRRRTMEAEGKNPYAEPEDQKPKKKVERAKFTGEVIRRYQDDGYLDKNLLERPSTTEKEEARHCEKLLEFWDEIAIEDVVDKICDDYRDWRVENVRQGEGLRTIDRELNTLNNAFRYCKRRDFVRVNPVADRPKYQPGSRVRHCREFCPQDADELHEHAAVLFEHPHTVVLGFQLLAEAYSGQRTSEVLQWGTGKYGTLTPDGKYMYVWRVKGQHAVNPYCANHEAMQVLMKAHAAWKAVNFPNTPEFFPSHLGGVVGKGALVHALLRLFKRKKLKRKLTSHGAGRAFYVLVRRSHGLKDEVIAHELGQTSGGQCIKSVYGGVPENWQNGEAPKLSWLPTKAPLAWAKLEKNGWKLCETAVDQESVPHTLPNA